MNNKVVTRLLKVISLLSILLFYSHGHTVTNVFVAQHIEMAQNAMHENNYMLALQHLQRAIAIDSFNPTLYQLITQVYIAQEEPKKALENANKIIGLTRQGEDYALRATIHIQDNNYKAAIKDIRTAIQKDGNVPEYIEILAFAYYKQKRYNDAEKTMGQLMHLGQKTPQYIYFLSLIQMNANKIDEAINNINQAILLEPRPTYFLFLATLQARTKQCITSKETIEQYKKRMSPHENRAEIEGFLKIYEDNCHESLLIIMPTMPIILESPVYVAPMKQPQRKETNTMPNEERKRQTLRRQSRVTYTEKQLLGIDPIHPAPEEETSTYANTFDAIIQRFKEAEEERKNKPIK